MVVDIVVGFFLNYMAHLEYFYIVQNVDVITGYLAKELLFLRCAAMTVQTGTRLTAFSIFRLVPLHFGLITNLECQSFS